MKKSVITLCALCVFVGNLIAQTPNANAPKYGGWVFLNGKEVYDHFKGGDKFPPASLKSTALASSYAITPKMQNKVTQLIQAFKDAYPKPYLESMMFDLRAIKKATNNNATRFSMNVGDYPFFYTANGDVKPINVMSQLGSMQKVAIKVNTYPNEEKSSNMELLPFQKMHYYLKAIEEKDFYGIKSLHIITPQVNAEEYVEKSSFKSKVFDYQIPNEPNSPYIKWYTIITRDDKKFNFDNVENSIILTYNKQLPFIPLTKKQFLELIELSIQKNIEQHNKVVAFMKPELGYKDKDFKKAAQISKEYLEQLALVQEIRTNNLNTINEKALINPYYSNLMLNVSLIEVFIANKNDKGPRAEKNEYDFSDLFITEESRAYIPARIDKNYYKTCTAYEIRTIEIKWKYKTRRPTHSDYQKIRTESGSYIFSDEPGSLMNSIVHKLDWKKLELLLNK
jgi:hypothetical protein